MIHVCSLARLHETVTTTGASHIVSLITRTYPVERPAAIMEDNHLWLDIDDICAPLDGYILPQAHHVEQLLKFVRAWDRARPLVVHCHAGISRSSAAAFATACALAPHRDERIIALSVRRASPTALPNARIVSLADHLLGRKGRMIAAVAAMSPYTPCFTEALPFRIDLE
jgi:predicted protein tyrosine phosphatase